MAPGAKKKSYNKKTIENKSDNNKSCIKSKASSEVKVSNDPLDVNHAEKEFENKTDDEQSKKYSKRKIFNNWQKYEESVSDPYVDTPRGKDLEVLLSYSGGTGSQFQLQEEKEWEEAGFSEKHISLDLKDVINVIKCIPFHKLLQVSPSTFSQEHIDKFNSSAEYWKNSYLPCPNVLPSSENVCDKKERIEILNNDLNIVDSDEADEEQELKPASSVCLEEKTETIIESLASCLSLKAPSFEKPDSHVKTKIEASNSTDDLDFLLSLNVSLKNPMQKESNETKTNVDDWLNSILDD